MKRYTITDGTKFVQKAVAVKVIYVCTEATVATKSISTRGVIELVENVWLLKAYGRNC